MFARKKNGLNIANLQLPITDIMAPSARVLGMYYLSSKRKMKHVKLEVIFEYDQIMT